MPNLLVTTQSLMVWFWSAITCRSQLLHLSGIFCLWRLALNSGVGRYPAATCSLKQYWRRSTKLFGGVSPILSAVSLRFTPCTCLKIFLTFSVPFLSTHLQISLRKLQLTGLQFIYIGVISIASVTLVWKCVWEMMPSWSAHEVEVAAISVSPLPVMPYWPLIQRVLSEMFLFIIIFLNTAHSIGHEVRSFFLGDWSADNRL
jgi:hypothetical protein